MAESKAPETPQSRSVGRQTITPHAKAPANAEAVDPATVRGLREQVIAALGRGEMTATGREDCLALLRTRLTPS